MFTEKTVKAVKTFNLHETDDYEELQDLLNNPKARIIDKQKILRTFTDYDGETSSSRTELELVVEWEECSL